MTYDASVDGHLSRCKALRDCGTLKDLMYAALELRLGVEARLSESVQAVEGLSEVQRGKWKVVHLANTLEATKRSNGDDIFTLVYHLKVPDEIFELHYFPVSKRLTEIVGRLGNFLHRNDRLVLDPMGVQRELTSILKEGYGLLMMANSGELLGLPQLDPNTNSLNVILKFPDGDARAPALQVALAAGRKYRVDSFTITPAGPMTYSSQRRAPSPPVRSTGAITNAHRTD